MSDAPVVAWVTDDVEPERRTGDDVDEPDAEFDTDTLDDGFDLDALDAAGYDVVRTTASDVPARIESAETECLVCRSDLESADPIAVLEKVRESDPDVPFVLVAVDGDERLPHRAVAAGVSEYVPVTDDAGADLVAAVERAIAAGERARERRRAAVQLAALFEDTPDPVIEYEFVDDEPVVRSVNRAFVDTFGFESSAVVGEPMNDVIVPKGKEAEARTLDRRVKEGDRVAVELRRETTDGVREFLFRNIGVETGTGGPDGYAMYIDVTEQKERERRLQRQNERLDEFASVVSHDLRNPMGAVKHRIEMARQTGDEDHLDDALGALDRMDELLRELLQMTREGENLGRAEPVSLADVASAAWARVETGDATLAVDVDEDRCVEADRARLAHLLGNLFINAVEHSGAGFDDEIDRGNGESGGGGSGGADSDGGDASAGVEITVGAGPDDSIYVEDDGAGIPPAERENVFQSGYTTGEDGTGFGLTIVKQVARAHGWEVGVTDGTDGGARFEFRGVEFVDP